MELTIRFVEPEMNMEEQFYIDDTVEVDTLEQNINDEMIQCSCIISYRYGV